MTKNLRELRKDKNLTSEQLAVILGKSHATINNWESGRREMSLHPQVIKLYIETLDITFDEFILACEMSRKLWLDENS